MRVALALHDYSKFMQDIIRGQRRRITTPSVSERHRAAASFMKPLTMIYELAAQRYCSPEHLPHVRLFLHYQHKCSINIRVRICLLLGQSRLVTFR